MRVIKLETLYKDMRKNKKRLILVLAVFAVLFGVLGIRGVKKAVAKNQDAIAAYEKEYANYQKDLEEYENSLEANRENLKTLEDQYQRQLDYCNNSIYMQMDGSNFYKAEAKCTVVPTGENNNQNAVAGLLASYMTSNAGIADAAKRIEGMQPEYLKELLGSNSSGAVITITAMHFDEQMADTILKTLENVLQDYMVRLEADYGSYTMERTSEAVIRYTDISVMNTQSSALNNLRNYRTSVADMKNSISNKEQDMEEYKSENEPVSVAPIGMKGKLLAEVQYVIIGLVLGVFVLAAWSGCKILFAKKMQNLDYLEEKGIPVLGTGMQDGEWNTMLVDVELTVKTTGNLALYLETVETTEETETVVDRIKRHLAQSGIQVSSGNCASGNEEVLRQMSTCKNVLILVEQGVATYKNMDQVLAYADRYKANMIGAVLWNLQKNKEELS